MNISSELKMSTFDFNRNDLRFFWWNITNYQHFVQLATLEVSHKQLITLDISCKYLQSLVFTLPHGKFWYLNCYEMKFKHFMQCNPSVSALFLQGDCWDFKISENK